MKTGLTWIRAMPAVDRRTIEEVQDYLGVVFPADFVECVLAYNGGKPNLRALDIPGRDGIDFGGLLSFAHGPRTIDHVFDRMKDQLPRGVVPFGSDLAGNLICFDYRSDTTHPTVVFWDHEEAEFSPISNTFSGFLDMLYDD